MFNPHCRSQSAMPCNRYIEGTRRNWNDISDTTESTRGIQSVMKVIAVSSQMQSSTKRTKSHYKTVAHVIKTAARTSATGMHRVPSFVLHPHWPRPATKGPTGTRGGEKYHVNDTHIQAKPRESNSALDCMKNIGVAICRINGISATATIDT